MVTVVDLDLPYSVTLISGLPEFAAARRIEDQLRLDAEVPRLPGSHRASQSPTTFHVACDGTRRPLGVGCSTVGPLAELHLGLAMAAAGQPLPGPDVLPEPVCEFASLAVARDAGAHRITGVTETLYRSFYRHAVASRARSLALAVEPWLFDILGEEYGIPLHVLGPSLELGGRDLVPAGGIIEDLEAGVAAANPEFAAFLGIGRRPVVGRLDGYAPELVPAPAIRTRPAG